MKGHLKLREEHLQLRLIIADGDVSLKHFWGKTIFFAGIYA